MQEIVEMKSEELTFTLETSGKLSAIISQARPNCYPELLKIAL